MLELVLGVIIVAGLTLFTGQILGRYHETKREEASALYLEKLAEAATSYAGSAAFQSAINLGNLGSDDPTLTAFPAVEIATLKSEGYLPPSFPATDAYGGTPRILYREGMVQKTGETEKGYVLNTIALLDHPAAMGRPRAMRILMQIPPQKTKGARRAHFSNDKLYGARGVEIEGAEAASLRGTTTAPTSLALMRSSPMKGRASGTPLEITVPPLDVSAYAAALGTAIEKMAKKYEDRIKEKLRLFDWSVHNAQAQMRLEDANPVNGIPAWDVPPHTCPEGFAPQTALYDKGGANFLRPSLNDMADERVSESAGIHHKAKVRIGGGSTQTITARKRTHWLPRTIPPHNRKNRNVLFLDSSTSQPVSGMHRSDGTEGDNLVFSTNWDANPATGYLNSFRFKNTQHHHRGRNDHTHTILSIRGKQVSATQDSINRASRCLRDKSGNNIKISLWMREARYTSYAGSGENRHRHEWKVSAPSSSPQFTECTYVRRNEVAPIRKCNFDKAAYYKKYPMRVKLVPPTDQ